MMRKVEVTILGKVEKIAERRVGKSRYISSILLAIIILTPIKLYSFIYISIINNDVIMRYKQEVGDEEGDGNGNGNGNGNSGGE